MATYATAVTIARRGVATKTFLAASVAAATGRQARTYGSSGNPDSLVASMGKDYAISRVEGGGGDITRPLVGLLHPPDRRGNRAQAATP